MGVSGLADLVLAGQDARRGDRGRPRRRRPRPRPDRAARAAPVRGQGPRGRRPHGARGRRDGPGGRGPGRVAGRPDGPAEVADYPAWETLPHERLSPRSDTVGRRLAVLRRLAHPGTDASNGPLKVVVAPVRSVLQPQVKGLADLEPVELAVGDEADLDDVVRRLAGAAYTRVDLVEKRGEFAVRGGIVDVFPPTEEHPLRVEFWGDEVEEIRSFAVADQRTLEQAERLWAPPCRELLLTDEVREPGRRAAARATRSSPRSSRSSPRGTRSRGWSRWPRCSSTRWSCSSTCCPPQTHVLVLDPERVRSRAHDLVAHQRGVPARRPGPRPPAVGQAPIDLGAASYRSLADVRAPAWRRASRGGACRRSAWTGAETSTARSAPDALRDVDGRDRHRSTSTPRPARSSRGRCRCGRSRPTTATWSARSPTSRPGSRDGWRVVLVSEGHGPAQRMVEVLASTTWPSGTSSRSTAATSRGRRWCTSPRPPSTHGFVDEAPLARGAHRRRHRRAARRPPRTCARCRPAASSRSTRSS